MVVVKMVDAINGVSVIASRGMLVMIAPNVLVPLVHL